MALRTPPLHSLHQDAGARFTGFGGWDMPVEFDSIRDEHTAVRTDAGKFDVSHMGEIQVTGRDAERLTNRLTTNDVSRLDPGESLYAMITDEAGIILDDTVIYRQGAEAFLFIPNAGHDEQMTDRWRSYGDDWGLEATVENVTEGYGMIAIQGPNAADLVQTVAADRVTDLSRFEAQSTAIAAIDCYVARTGYTGEDGFEVIAPWDDLSTVWTAFDCQPCGLGARDTLRQEMGYLLSGQDFHPEENPRNPFEAGVGFTVKLDTDFVGRDALEQVEAEGIDEKFVGLTLIERGIPRHGYEITDRSGAAIGIVTSGTMSPTLGEAIGLGYVPVDFAAPETAIGVRIRGETKKAKTRTTPFLPDK